MAAILGKVRIVLTGLPFLRAFTDQMSSFVKLQESVGWDTPQPVPKDLQLQILEVKKFTSKLAREKIKAKLPIRNIPSDASGLG